jgi:4-hydroxyphenylacetaldehyde oxime monooxygenase
VLDDAMDVMASFSAEDFFPNAAGRLTGFLALRQILTAGTGAFLL